MAHRECSNDALSPRYGLDKLRRGFRVAGQFLLSLPFWTLGSTGVSNRVHERFAQSQPFAIRYAGPEMTVPSTALAGEPPLGPRRSAHIRRGTEALRGACGGLLEERSEAQQRRQASLKTRRDAPSTEVRFM
jgi:hypothetical protein